MWRLLVQYFTKARFWAFFISCTFIYSFSLELCAQTNTNALPLWFTEPQPTFQAAAVVPIYARKDSIVWNEALLKATQSLNANHMLSYYKESFGRFGEYVIFPEYSIEEVYTPQDVVVLDTASVGSYFYMAVAPDSSLSPVASDSLDRFIEAEGQYSFLEYSPYLAWEKAKIKAIDAIAYELGVQISQKAEWSTGGFSDLSYMETKFIIRNIQVVQRYMVKNQCFVKVRIRKSDINSY